MSSSLAKNAPNRSLKLRSDGKTPLRSSINLINHSNQNSLNNLKNNQIIKSNEKSCEPKVSLTEQSSNTDLNKSKQISSPPLKKKINDKEIKIKSTKIKKSIKRQSIDKKKIKKAIKIVLNKDERVKRWLTTKEPVQDFEYWRLSSERLSVELKESLDELDELELENELLRAEFDEMTKLAENAYKLNKLFNKIGLNQLNDEHDNDDEHNDGGHNNDEHNANQDD